MPWPNRAKTAIANRKEGALVPSISGNFRADLKEIATRNSAARRIIAGFSTVIPTLPDLWQLIDSALADVRTLIAELIALRAELAEIRRDRANLVAAARATIGAHHDGERDPLSYLRDELDARGQLPPVARSGA